MRAVLLASVLVFTASAVAAHPFAVTMPDQAVAMRLVLPSQDRMAADFAGRARADSALIEPGRARPDSAPGLSLGLVQAEPADDPRPGHHRRILQYRVDGVSVLGGSVGGSLGGGGAVFSLHWPSGQ
jgi:hypothetical protein